MSDKAERRVAGGAVAVYHEARLGELVEHVAESLSRFRAGEIDAFEADRVLFQYHRASKELWKFCSLGDARFAASMIGDGPHIDWWERGAPYQR